MENIRYISGDIIAAVFVPWGMGKTLPEAESAERFPQQAACRYFPESVERIDASHNPKLKPEEFWDEVDTLITKGCLPYTI